MSIGEKPAALFFAHLSTEARLFRLASHAEKRCYPETALLCFVDCTRMKSTSNVTFLTESQPKQAKNKVSSAVRRRLLFYFFKILSRKTVPQHRRVGFNIFQSILCTGYHISVKIERGLMRKELSKRIEFMGECSDARTVVFKPIIMSGQEPTPRMVNSRQRRRYWRDEL